jgi:hypothetical protein
LLAHLPHVGACVLVDALDLIDSTHIDRDVVTDVRNVGPEFENFAHDVGASAADFGQEVGAKTGDFGQKLAPQVGDFERKVGPQAGDLGQNSVLRSAI